MKKFIGLLGLFSLVFISAVALPCFATVATSTAPFSGDIQQYMQTQKTTLNALFDSGYASVYQELSKTGLSILKTTDYQSLVCLGIFPADSILSALQKDKITLKTSLNRDISELENKVAGLEEKNRLQQENSVDLFDGSTYFIQKGLLKTDIDTNITRDTGLIASFQSGYKAKIRNFIIDYAQYGAQNKDLVKTLNAKISKITFITSGFNAVQNKVANMYQAMGISDIMNNYDVLKTRALSTLGAQLDPIIALKIKIFKFLPTLSGELSVQKEAALKQYMLDMDQYFSSVFQRRYDRAAYTKLVDQFTKFQTSYYSNQRLNCTNVIGGASDDNGLAVLSQQINKVSANISSGIAAAQSSASKATFKSTLLSGFQNIFNTQIIKQKLATFQNGIRSVITNLQNILTPPTVTPPTTPVVDAVTLPMGVTFTRPFTLGQKANDVGTLQKILLALELYTGAIDNIFNQATKDALYSYQLQKGILTAASNKGLRGLFGPATRKSVNILVNK